MKRIKLIFMFGILMMLNINFGHGQGFKVLHIGDTIPEAFYKEVAELGSTGKMFSESKGRLVILDFWSTYCGTCLESFPKMHELQNEFGNEIQIFTVNTFEDSVAIAKRMDMPNMQKYQIDLPDIANAKIFQQLFPHRVVPHHVWIDKNGVVQVIGSPLNTHPEKIRDALKGEHVFSLKGPNNSKAIDKNTSLHKIIGKEIDQQSSFVFTKHNNEYSPDAAMIFVGILDSTTYEIRDTYFNHDVLELYRRVFMDHIAPRNNKAVYSGIWGKNAGFWRDYYLLEDVDTLKLSSSYIPYLDRTDEVFIESRFSYEQILSDACDKTDRAIFMLDNLNQYFGKELGIEGRLMEREVLCYVLKSDRADEIVDSYLGKTPLNLALSYRVYQLFSEHPERFLPFMFDETGLENVQDLVLPDSKSDCTFEELIELLNRFGVYIEEEMRMIPFVQISII